MGTAKGGDMTDQHLDLLQFFNSAYYQKFTSIDEPDVYLWAECYSTDGAGATFDGTASGTVAVTSISKKEMVTFRVMNQLVWNLRCS
jgi:hypothetical protein